MILIIEVEKDKLGTFIRDYYTDKTFINRRNQKKFVPSQRECLSAGIILSKLNQVAMRDQYMRSP